MESPLAQLEDEVRSYIGYDRVLASIDARRGTAAEWSDMRQFAGPDGAAWQLVNDQTVLTDLPGLVQRLYLYQSGESRLMIELFVSSRGPRPALDRLVGMIGATSIGYRAYTPCEVKVGALCLMIPSTEQPLLLMLSGNVFVRLDRTEGVPLDLQKLAANLNAFIESHTVADVTEKLPNVEAIGDNPAAASVGRDVRIQLRFPVGAQAQTLWDFTPRLDADVAELQAKGADSATLRVKRPGLLALPITVADRRTLLSSEIRVSINVRE